MAYRKVSLVGGEYYHIYNRGNSKQNIFLDDEDRERFVKLLYLCNSVRSINFRDDIVEMGIDAWDFDRAQTIVSIGAWVIMPNHFHIYITSGNSPEDRLKGKRESAVTEFMRKMATSYSKYFNKKYNRTGSLFEGRFKATHVSTDKQAKYLFSYIHLNPVKLIEPKWKEMGVVNIPQTIKYLKDYEWSSYQDHLGVEREENVIVRQKDFPEYFDNKELLGREMFEWLKYSQE